MRLFVAIELDEPFRNHLIKLQDSLRLMLPKVSFTKPENLHLTLEFIGEVEERKVPALCDALGAVARDGEFPVRYVGLDLLPPHGPIRILAAAVDGGEKLPALQSRIEDACAAQQIPRENRRFRAHITLARARDGLARSTGSKLLQQLGPVKSAEMVVGSFVLMLSTLSNKGSEYSCLYKIALV
ncbi:MAG TPA: RNA 2',3'-cyclic phosphodiesterase [Tepidisphaeraceae bacterium]|jgi:2'-5' RNA ligase|nr:RNA 2',3'-cyclic phosphodiesterase [Tepidisphaeraceae bacterium]